jgi:Leucine-rich repeat (LRR) protein
LKNLVEEDEGVYVVEIENSKLPSLKLRRKPITLELVQQLLGKDEEALIKLNEIVSNGEGGEGGRSSNWGDGYPATWEGVKTKRNRVIGLDLSGLGLVGALPLEIGNLDSLKRLDLFGNELESLPSEIGNLKALEYLDVDGNKLTSLPVEIGGMESLKTLWLARNELESLPESIGNLSSLERLFVQENKLTSLPASLSNLSKLEVLDVSLNELPTLPILNMSSLKVLKANDNFLTSVNLAGAVGIEELELDDNELSEFGLTRSGYPNLKRISMRRNNLTFEDLEAVVRETWTISYSPQKKEEPDVTIGAEAGSRLVLRQTIGGSSNAYQWYKDGNLIENENLDSLVIAIVTPEAQGVYEARVTNSIVAGLTIESRRQTVTVGCASKAATLSAIGSITFCSNESIVSKLKIEAENGESYKWYRNGQEQLLLKGEEVEIYEAGEYEVQVTDQGGCIVMSNKVIISQREALEVVVEEKGNEVLEAIIGEEGSYQWYRDGKAIEGAVSKEYGIEVRGTYWVGFTSSATGCVSYSEAKEYKVTGVSEEELSNETWLYPNPASSKVKLGIGERVRGEVEIEVLSLTGVLVKKLSINSELKREEEIGLEDLPSGVYLVRIQTEDKVTVVKRLTKQ